MRRKLTAEEQRIVNNPPRTEITHRGEPVHSEEDVNRLARLGTPPRLHPQSWRELRQLVKLHGAEAIFDALRIIVKEKSK